MKTFPLSIIFDAVEDEENVRPDGYSGRGMYGKTCASVSFESFGDAFVFFANLGVVVGVVVGRLASEDEGSDLDRQLNSLMRAVTTDSMGRGVVAYFPGWTFV